MRSISTYNSITLSTLMCVEFISSGFPFISNFSPRQILLILSGGSFCFNTTPVLLATTFSDQWVETDFEVEFLYLFSYVYFIIFLIEFETNFDKIQGMKVVFRSYHFPSLILGHFWQRS